MRDLILSTIAKAAAPLGMNGSQVMIKRGQDLPALPLPRIELSFLSETFISSGRSLGTKISANRDEKLWVTELYQVNLPIVVEILTSDAIWLENFYKSLVAALPSDFNDRYGNLVKVLVSKGEWKDYADDQAFKDGTELKVRYGYFLYLNATWRITSEHKRQYLKDFTFNLNLKTGGKNGPR